MEGKNLQPYNMDPSTVAGHVAIVPAIDTRLGFVPTYVSGPSSVSSLMVPSTGGGSSGYNWMIPLPGGNATFFDRCFIVEADFKVVISGATANPARCAQDALRSYPLNNLISNLAVSVNNQSLTFPTANYIAMLQRFWKPYGDGLCPEYPDPVGSYKATLATVDLNPMGGCASRIEGALPKRGDYPMKFDPHGAGDPYTTEITFKLYEPLIAPFLNMRPGQGLGFSNISTPISVQITLIPDLGRMWSHNQDAYNSTGIVVTPPTNAYLHVASYTPPAGVPRQLLTYNCPRFDRVILMAGDVAAAADVSANSQTVQLQVIPRYIYVAVIPNTSAHPTYTEADWALTLNKVTITLGNATLLSQMTAVDLFNMSKRCGLQGPYAAWAGKGLMPGAAPSYLDLSGSFLKIDVARDLTLDDGMYVGKQVATSMTVTVTATNNTTTPMNGAMLFVGYETPGVLSINEDCSAMWTVGLVGDRPAIGEGASYVAYEDSSRMGGGFGDFFAKLFSRVRSAFPKIQGFLKDTQLASKGLAALGHPNASATLARMGYGAGVPAGGAVASRASLLARLAS